MTWFSETRDRIDPSSKIRTPTMNVRSKWEKEDFVVQEKLTPVVEYEVFTERWRKGACISALFSW